MLRLKEKPIIERNQLIVFLFLSLLMFVLTLILSLQEIEFIQNFLGTLNPLVVIIIVILLGIITLTYLFYTGHFQILKKERIKKSIIFLPLTLIFLTGAILIDLIFTFPEDINLLLPNSLLFYPMIGFIVEIIFHVVPLSLLFALLMNIFKNVDKKRITIICIVIVSIIEPFYQFVFSGGSGFPLWIRTLDMIRLFFFSLVQLYIFKNNDFLSMYSFRLVYYLLWHVIWGTIRVTIFF
jgi:hypothetical protein